MKKKISISVLITYYDEGALLEECLKSLFSGSSYPYEVIIYDDCSPNIPAREVIDEDLPVRVLRGEENVGPSRGRNRLLEYATGDYVHYHDADDLFHEDWCFRVRETLISHGPDFILNEVSSMRKGKKVSERVLGLAELREEEDLLRFCVRHPVLAVSGTYRRRLLESVGGYCPDFWQAEDYDLHIRLALQQPTWKCILQPLATIRLRPGGRSRSNRDEVGRSVVQIAESLRDELPESYHEDLAEKVAWAGSLLYRYATPSEAKRAFDFARELGPPSEFQGEHGGYRLLARMAGPFVAEKVGALYRQLLPEGIRGIIPRG